MNATGCLNIIVYTRVYMYIFKWQYNSMTPNFEISAANQAEYVHWLIAKTVIKMFTSIKTSDLIKSKFNEIKLN
jgi:hypothetical protein